jgi:hypothetical protein
VDAPNGSLSADTTAPRLKELCQFEWLDQALWPLNRFERMTRWTRRKWNGLRRRLGLVSTNPPLRRRRAPGGPPGGRAGAAGRSALRTTPRRPGGRLKAGDVVMVRPLDEIRQTLDRTGKHDGLKFLRPMEQYCGETHRVMKRVKYILDDRTHVMRKTRHTVLLEGVICHGEGIYGRENCDRSCFFFWKDAWLVKLSDPADNSGD